MSRKILLFLSKKSGSRPGHKVSGTRSKFPNLNENGQKSHFLRGFLTQNPVNILSRSATDRQGKYMKPGHKFIIHVRDILNQNLH